MTPLELNIGLAACGPAGEAREAFDMLGQGHADLYFARQYARLSRSWKDKAAAEHHICALADVAAFVFAFIRSDTRLDDDKRAGLISFIFERGMNMPQPDRPTL